MANIQSLVNMLASPKASTRFDACEELRVAQGLPPEAIAALECAFDDPDPSVRESALSALRVHAPGSSRIPCFEREAAAARAAEIAAMESAAFALRVAETPAVTAPADSAVARYLGLVSASVAILWPPAATSDFHLQLREAKRAAVLQLRESAVRLGANAVVDINYGCITLPPNHLVVTADGTAVTRKVGPDIAFFLAF